MIIDIMPRSIIRTVTAPEKLGSKYSFRTKAKSMTTIALKNFRKYEGSPTGKIEVSLAVRQKGICET